MDTMSDLWDLSGGLPAPVPAEEVGEQMGSMDPLLLCDDRYVYPAMENGGSGICRSCDP